MVHQGRGHVAERRPGGRSHTRGGPPVDIVGGRSGDGIPGDRHAVGAAGGEHARRGGRQGGRAGGRGRHLTGGGAAFASRVFGGDDVESRWCRAVRLVCTKGEVALAIGVPVAGVTPVAVAQ